MTARLIAERHGRVLVLTISNPGARNALHPDIYAAGTRALTDLRPDDEVGAVVLTGEGDTFSAGGNVNRLLEFREQDPAVLLDQIEVFHDWIRAIRACDRPVVAAVEGAAAGGGFSLALACDQIVAARDARFLTAYVRIGITPDGGASHWLGSRLPYPIAYELLVTGNPVDAARLHALGVVNRLVAPGEATATAVAYAAELAAGPGQALGRMKRLLDASAAQGLDAHLERERDAMVECLFSQDGGEGLRAFLEKRKPRFSRGA